MDFVLNVGVWRLNMIVRIVKYYVDGVLNMDNLWRLDKIVKTFEYVVYFVLNKISV